MALVAAKCTECGAAIEVEDTKDAGICNFCGTAFITQKVINNTNVQNTFNVEHLVMQGGATAENFLIRARQARDSFDLIKAAEFACRALDLEPLNEEAQELSEVKGMLGGREISVKQLKNIDVLIFSSNPDQFAAHKVLGPLLGKGWSNTKVMQIIIQWKSSGLPHVLQNWDTADKLKGGCYIATCVYGSYDCPKVWVLRRHRDYNLKTRHSGRLFVKFYYALAPIVIKLFGKQTWFNSYWKKRLDKKVKKLKTKGFSDLPYND